jgi:hypothetical protein
MNRTLLQRVRINRPGASRSSSGRRPAPLADAGYRYGGAGQGSRMPSQRATTRMQRPY